MNNTDLESDERYKGTFTQAYSKNYSYGLLMLQKETTYIL